MLAECGSKVAIDSLASRVITQQGTYNRCARRPLLHKSRKESAAQTTCWMRVMLSPFSRMRPNEPPDSATSVKEERQPRTELSPRLRVLHIYLCRVVYHYVHELIETLQGSASAPRSARLTTLRECIESEWKHSSRAVNVCKEEAAAFVHTEIQRECSNVHSGHAQLSSPQYASRCCHTTRSRLLISVRLH